MNPRTGSSTNGHSPQLRYGTGATSVGNVLIVLSGKGVRALRLLHKKKETAERAELRRAHPGFEWIADEKAVRPVLAHVRDLLEARTPRGVIALDLDGTPFQQRVRQEMIKIPPGSTCSYGELARRAGKPRAARAVGTICARNPIALLVPCHRVLASGGRLGGYGYGLDVKRKLLELEGAL